MKTFMDKDFLLSTDTARQLYHDYAAGCPIIDYHCHVSPKEIWEDKHFKNITDIWLSGDHYKWRLMRSDGIDEYYITGGASDYEKFMKFASVLPKAIGNPMYHWCHLELKEYFGYTGVLNEKTAHEVWTLTEKMLKEDDMGVRGIIKKSNVQFIGTTDDPTDNLEWHRNLMEDGSFETIVAPSFRPDKALGIDKNGWREYICTLSEVCGIKIDSIKTLEQALLQRIDFFNESGCKASDHGLDHMVYAEASAEELEEIMSKALGGETVTAHEAECFKTHFLLLCARKYAQIGWAMQLHYNCMRNPNRKMFSLLGPDTGFDCIGPDNGSNKLALLLNRLFEEGSLPKTIIYSLDASDNSFIDSLIGSYQGTEIAGKLQHGSAWWFNDNLQGMKEQLISLANLSILGNFIGMLTDSRSFLSYTRHEYFRRILCELLGQWVENGEYPADFDTLGMIVKGICHDNAQTYFNITAK